MSMRIFIFAFLAVSALAMTSCKRKVNVAALPYDLQQQYTNPKETKGGFEEGVKAFNAGNYDRAIELLGALNVQGQDKAFVLNLQGAAYTKKKQYMRAQSCFQNALSYAPDAYAPQFNLCEVYFLQGKYDEALEKFVKLAQTTQPTELLLFKIFLCHLKLGDKDAAIRVLGQIPTLGATPAWYFASAAWEFNKGDTSKGRGFLKTAKSIFPNAEARQHFEETFTELGWAIK